MSLESQTHGLKGAECRKTTDKDRKGTGTEPPIDGVLPHGFPPGWHVKYKSVVTARGNRSYLERYQSVDGTYSGLTKEEAVRADAYHNGQDPEDAVVRFRALQAEHKRRQEPNVLLFWERFGRLRFFLRKLPGYSIIGLTRACCLIEGPNGGKWCSLRDLEAHLGAQIASGVDISAAVQEAKRHPLEERSMRPQWVQRQLRCRKGLARTGAHELAKRKRWSPKQLRKWCDFTFWKRAQRLAALVPRGGPDDRLARALARRSRLRQPTARAAWGPIHLEGAAQGSADEAWIRGHPLWRKVALRGYPLPISEREILALRAYTPTNMGGTADLRYF